MPNVSPSLYPRRYSLDTNSLDDTCHQSNSTSIQPEEHGTADKPRMNPRVQLKPSWKPRKSAFRNSAQHPSQCIPAMQSNGKVCAPSKSGYISPQWGWYISTTPPTPEYSSKNQVLSHQMNTNHFQTSNRGGPVHGNFWKQPWNPSTTPIQEASPKPIFVKHAPSYSGGWPTVPL
jgi:hypothetical protein|eukprot:scaffold2184_cov266-Chaetoceros_neogracile.AAC.33